LIEAELKARLARPYHVRAALRRRAEPERAVYRDTYYDSPAGDLHRAGRELRLRTVERADHTEHLLTFSETAAGAASGSGPEHETAVAAPAVIDHLVRALGYHPAIQLTRDCENHRFTDDGREFTATVVTVPELDGTFLEVQTVTSEYDLDQAMAAVRQLLNRLGIGADELTTEQYIDTVRSART
jgi:adenylate cyclase, class 2